MNRHLVYSVGLLSLVEAHQIRLRHCVFSLMNSAAVKTAYLLVTHGSRDPRSQAGAEQLAQQLRQRFGLVGDRPGEDAGAEQIVAIATAVLELGPAPLHIQIEKFARKVAPLGVTRLKLLPLFLLPGVHVREDLPEELHLAQAALAAQPVLAASVTATAMSGDGLQGTGVGELTLELLPHIGEGDSLIPVLKAQQKALCQQLARTGAGDRLPALAGVGGGESSTRGQVEELQPEQVDWVLLAHGSRRPAAGQAIGDLARSLGARPAYWVGTPSLADCLAEKASAHGGGLVDHHRPLGVLSYFLFAGGITDRLQGTLQAADLDAPGVMSAPLGDFSALAVVVAQAMGHPDLTM